MTTWRRKARLGIGVVAGVYLLYLGWAVRPMGARPKELAGQVAATLAKEAAGIRDRLRFRDFVYDDHSAGGSYRIRASEALGFSSDGDDVFRLMDVRVETGGQEGRPGLTLRAPRAEFKQGTKALRVYDGVTMEGETAALRAASFRFDSVKREFLSEGPVTMTRGRMVGHADRGTLETGDGRVRLEGHVRMGGMAEQGRFLDIAAPSLTVNRSGTMLASGGVRVRTSDAVLRSETVERVSDAAGDRFRTSGETTVLFLSGDAARRLLLASGGGFRPPVSSPGPAGPPGSISGPTRRRARDGPWLPASRRPSPKESSRSSRRRTACKARRRRRRTGSPERG